MSSKFWPVPITIALIISAYALGNAILEASRMGTYQMPFNWWHAALFIICYWLYEMSGQWLSGSDKEYQ